MELVGRHSSAKHLQNLANVKEGRLCRPYKFSRHWQLNRLPRQVITTKLANVTSRHGGGQNSIAGASACHRVFIKPFNDKIHHLMRRDLVQCIGHCDWPTPHKSSHDVFRSIINYRVRDPVDLSDPRIPGEFVVLNLFLMPASEGDS